MAQSLENQAAWLPASKVKPLQIGPAPYTRPGPGQLVVKNSALGINSVDWAKQMLGETLLNHIKYPIVLGADVSGIVVEVGEGVKHFRVGDRVTAAASSITTSNPTEGGFQLYTVVHEWLAARLPENISHEQASVLPLALLTASHGLFSKDYLALDLPTVPARGKTKRAIIITGGASAVGSSAIQLAVSAGYEVVSTASPKNFDYVKKLGAINVLDYKSETVVTDLAAAVRDYDLAGGYSIGDGSADLLTAVLARHEGPNTNRFVSLAGGSFTGRKGEMCVEVKFIVLDAAAISPDSVTAQVFESYLPRAGFGRRPICARARAASSWQGIRKDSGSLHGQHAGCFGKEDCGISVVSTDLRILQLLSAYSPGNLAPATYL